MPELPELVRLNSGPNRPNRRLNRTGMAAVGFAAAVLTFETWVRLAEAVGFKANWSLPAELSGPELTLRISWLMPIAVDVFAFTATRVWTRGTTDGSSARTVAHARRMALGIIGGSFCGNALYHAFIAANWVIAQCIPVVVIVGGIPPVLLALVVHLNQLLNEDDAARTVPEPAATGMPELGPEPKAEPAGRGPEPVAELAAAEPAPVAELGSPAQPRTEPESEGELNSEPNPNRRPNRRPNSTPNRAAAKPNSNASVQGRTDPELLPAVRQIAGDWYARTGARIGRAKLRTPLAEHPHGGRVGTERAAELIDAAEAELDTEPRPALHAVGSN